MANFFFATLNFLLKFFIGLAGFAAVLGWWQIYVHTPSGTVSGITPVDTLRAEQDKFEDQTVTVEGEVIHSYGIFSVGIFTLQDEGGKQLLVIVTTTGVPVVPEKDKKAKIKRTGVFRETITFNRLQIPLLFVQPKNDVGV
jgi:hypothetical protein